MGSVRKSNVKRVIKINNFMFFKIQYFAKTGYVDSELNPNEF